MQSQAIAEKIVNKILRGILFASPHTTLFTSRTRNIATLHIEWTDGLPVRLGYIKNSKDHIKP